MALRVPTLWLLGDLDESVPTFASVRVLEAIRDAGNRSHTIVVYPEADHGLRNVRTRESVPIWPDMVAWLEKEGVLAARGG
jgi:dipeptidyl aminopeptidase/acylaminoacyl peptidase